MNRAKSTYGTLTACLLALALVCAQPAAGDGGGAAPGETPATGSVAASTGGSPVGVTPGPSTKPKANPKPKPKTKVKRTPLLAGFTLSGSLTSDSATIKLRYRITAPARRVRVRGVVRTQSGRYVKTLELGVHRTNAVVTTDLSASELGVSRAGAYKLRLTARDGKNRAAQRAKNVPAWRAFNFGDHSFPLLGSYSFGGGDDGFGAGRPGHTHQGQDVIANAGTPIVAPYAGTISYVAYQAGGAGYYVVENADDGRDYVFMHLLKGSTAVRVGQRVRAGQRLGRVGATGRASGPHLHFEVWIGGPWQFGGRPTNPLPLLKAWAR